MIFLLALATADFSIDARNELFIHHPEGALQVIEKGLEQEPQSVKLWNQKIEALSLLSDTSALLKALQSYKEHFAVTDKVLEFVCWHFLKEGAANASQLMRMRARFISALANDARSVDILLTGLQDRSLQAKLFSIQLAASFLDTSIQKELLSLFEKDRSIDARMMACQAIGSVQALPLLQKRLQEADSAAQKELIIRAIIKLTKKIEPSYIEELAKSQVPGFRELAARLALDSKESLHAIVPLVQDLSERVQIAALETLGMAGKELIFEVPYENRSPALEIALLTYRIRTGKADSQVKERFFFFLQSSFVDIRQLATKALVSTREKGAAVAEGLLMQVEDPLVQMNLALYLIRERRLLQRSCALIADLLKNRHEKLSFEGECIVASKLNHLPYLPRYPETIDLLTRLKLACVLASVSSEPLEPLLRHFLKEKNGAVVGMAAALFIQQYDDEAIGEIKKLLQDSSFEIRLEAAIILALLAQDEAALQQLFSCFKEASSELQEEILYAIGAIGSRQALPFLTECLLHERQALKLAAAGSILQCLNK
jgi:HEAT repeat protein